MLRNHLAHNYSNNQTGFPRSTRLIQIDLKTVKFIEYFDLTREINCPSSVLALTDLVTLLFGVELDLVVDGRNDVLDVRALQVAAV